MSTESHVFDDCRRSEGPAHCHTGRPSSDWWNSDWLCQGQFVALFYRCKKTASAEFQRSIFYNVIKDGTVILSCGVTVAYILVWLSVD